MINHPYLRVGCHPFLTQAFLGLLWVCEILVLDSSVLELCDTSDFSSKHH
jgi:hypothetical protein